VLVEVADNGPGVPAEARRRVFEPFFTTKPQGEGTGVGLSFSLGLVEAHGGRLELLNDEEPGARFRITLPIGETGLAPAEAASAETPSKPALRRALVVDDEPEIADALVDFLSLEGFQCETANGGREAQGRLKDNSYDLVVSDLRMPEMDGPALYAWIKSERPELAARTVFATGDTLGATAAAFLAREGRPVMEKPFTPDSVRRLIDQLEVS
jgi:CheY-like chemotaxis protein